MHPSSKEYLDGGENLPLRMEKIAWSFFLASTGCRILEVSSPTSSFWNQRHKKSWESLELLMNLPLQLGKRTKRRVILIFQITPSADNKVKKQGFPTKIPCRVGILLPEKGFIPILSSNMVTTPWITLSEIIDEKLAFCRTGRHAGFIVISQQLSSEMIQRGLATCK